MKNILILSAVLVGLTGCSSGGSSDDDDSGGSGGGSSTNLNGTWTTGCIDLSVSGFVGSLLAILTVDGNNGALEATQYDDGACTSVTMVDSATASLEFGANVTVDGSVDGITTAKEIDSTVVTTTTFFEDSIGDMDFDIYAIKNDKLYFGREDVFESGSTPELRPTQLDEEFSYTRQ